MKLVDLNEFKKLISNLKIEETVSGGSVANSIVGLAQLGNEVGFIGKVNADKLGNEYEDGLKKEKVKYFYSKKEEKISTGTCLVLITPDSERTMCTFLGIAGRINENDVDASALKKVRLYFLKVIYGMRASQKKHWKKLLKIQIKLQCLCQISFVLKDIKKSSSI